MTNEKKRDVGNKQASTEDGSYRALEQCLYPRRLARLEQVLSQRSDSLTVVLDRVHSPHNISAVIRSADAFGLASIHLIGEDFQYSRGITLGTERWLELKKHQTAQDALRALHKLEYSLVVLQPKESPTTSGLPPAIPVTSLPFEKPLALIFGNERDGVSTEFRRAADFSAYIPMRGFVESLNISVACAICLFCSTISPTEPSARNSPISVKRREELRKLWLKQGVKRSEIILREMSQRGTEKARIDPNS